MLVILLLLILAAASKTAASARLRTRPERRLRAAEGSEVNFACFAEDPSAVNRVEWRFLNNTSFDLWLYSAGGLVLIPAVTRNFTGIYECEGYFGPEKVQSAYLELQVLRPLQIQKFVTEIGNLTVLTCRVRSDSPVVEFKWFWNGDNVLEGFDVFRAKSETDNRFSLEVESGKEWTAGRYSCELANDFGQNSSAQFSLPPDPSTPRIEVFRETIKLRLRIGKEWCADRIEVRLSTGETVAVPCRSADPISAFKQLISGFVDVIISPKRRSLEANSVYYGRAVVVDSNGRDIPASQSDFVFDTNELSPNNSSFSSLSRSGFIVHLVWMLVIGIQIL